MAKYAVGPKLHGIFAEDALARKQIRRSQNFGDWITVDHEVLSKEFESCNCHRYAVITRDLATQWFQSSPCQTKSPQETEKRLQKFLEPQARPKVIFSDKSVEFGKACENLSWNHCTSSLHRSEPSGIAASFWTGKLFVNFVWEKHFLSHKLLLDRWLNIIRFPRKTSQDSTSSVRKFLSI